MSKSQTIIAEDVIIDGDVKLDGDITVYGEIKGSLVTSGSVQLAKIGKIHVNVNCSFMEINGLINGDVFVDGSVELLSNCKLIGNIQYRALKIHDGAQFSGRCDIIVE